MFDERKTAYGHFRLIGDCRHRPTNGLPVASVDWDPLLLRPQHQCHRISENSPWDSKSAPMEGFLYKGQIDGELSCHTDIFIVPLHSVGANLSSHWRRCARQNKSTDHWKWHVRHSKFARLNQPNWEGDHSALRILALHHVQLARLNAATRVTMLPAVTEILLNLPAICPAKISG